MAQKKKPAKKTRSRSTRSVSSKGSGLSRLRAALSRTPSLILFIVLFGAAGIYMLVSTYALPGNGRGVPPNDPARGLNYDGLKRVDTGPCAGAFKVEQADENADHACTHPDPGPPGVDVRERDKTIDKELNDLAAYDAKYMPAGEDATIPEGTPPLVEAANVNGGYSLSEISGRNWPCFGTGTDGPRVRWIYVYKAGNTNRISSLRDNIAAIARRVTAVVYNSSMASGGTAQKVKFVTNSDCSLHIGAVALTGDLSNFSNIKTQLRAKGFNQSNRKYIAMVDTASNCGYGDLYPDESAAATNSNNGGNMISAVWRPCWNYGEPHELGHMLGAVQRSAPHATAGYHCWDDNDVMCYKDGTAGSEKFQNICTAAIKNWEYDCRFDDYYTRGAESSYLSTHWNIAENQYLTR